MTRTPVTARLVSLTLLAGAAIATAACARGHEETRTRHIELPRDCDTFVASYERYLAAPSMEAAQLAKARARQTRAALEEQVGTGDAKALAQKCRDNLQTIPRGFVSDLSTR